MQGEFIVHENTTPLPTIHVVSDSVGLTAQAMARAAAAQFGVTNPNIEVLPHVRSFEEVKQFIAEHGELHKRLCGDENLLIFYTLVDGDLRRTLSGLLREPSQRGGGRPHDRRHERHRQAVGADPFASAPAVCTWQTSTTSAASRPSSSPSPTTTAATRRRCRRPTSCCSACRARRRRLPPSTWPSRATRSPISRSIPPPSRPREVFDVDRTRLFGLMTTADVLVGIRQRRLGNAAVAASKYADPEYVYEDLDRARALMRKLGAIVIHTENRAVEETAQEILRYYERAHPQGADIVIRS